MAAGESISRKQFPDPHRSRGLLAPSDDDPPFAPLSDSEKVELQQDHEKRFGGDQGQRAGQMKKAYHQQERQTIAQQNRPPAQARAPRAAAQPRQPAQKRPVPVETKLLKLSKRLGSLSRMAKGHR